MKIAERIYRLSEEALREIEERLFDIGDFSYAIERTKNGLFLKSYSDAVDGVLKELGFEAVEEREVDPLEWVKNELKEPFEIAPGVVVDPAGNFEGSGTVLKIPPGMAFGTGIHPTTKMIARFMVDHFREGMSFLDVGTGSGILSILAAKMGASKVVAVDNDPLAVEVARENAERNRVRVEVLRSDLLSSVSGKFDFVAANIVPSILRRLADQISKVTKNGTLVALSGIDANGAEDIEKLYKGRGMEVVERRIEGEWAAILLRS